MGGLNQVVISKISNGHKSQPSIPNGSAARSLLHHCTHTKLLGWSAGPFLSFVFPRSRLTHTHSHLHSHSLTHSVTINYMAPPSTMRKRLLKLCLALSIPVIYLLHRNEELHFPILNSANGGRGKHGPGLFLEDVRTTPIANNLLAQNEGISRG